MKLFNLFAAAALSTLALAGCAATIGTSPKGLEMPIEKASFKLAADVKAGGYRIVATDELKTWLDQGKKMTIVSALPLKEDRELGILPGAVNGVMPKTEKELTQADRENLLKTVGTDRENAVVIYCGFVACRRSHIGAKLLVENGFRHVYRYPGGIAAWQEMGYPLIK